MHGYDIVLEVAQIRRWATAIGRHVTYVAIEGARHDVVLSRPEPRAAAYDEIDLDVDARSTREPACATGRSRARICGMSRMLPRAVRRSKATWRLLLGVVRPTLERPQEAARLLEAAGTRVRGPTDWVAQ